MTRVVVLLAVAAAVVGVAAIAIVRWILEVRRAPRPLPPLIFPLGSAKPGDSLGKADPYWREQPSPPAAPAPPTPASPPAASHSTPVMPTTPMKRVVPEDVPHHQNGHRRSVAVDHVDEGQPVSAETIRFVRPVEHAVQLLPGRLEVISGDSQHQEIRFVRIPGQPIELILGRDGGPSAQYVGLASATVSRRHAHFAYVNGRWVVRNLSKTNPLVVNDDEVSDADGGRALEDGDRLELGEVVLRFHAH